MTSKHSADGKPEATKLPPGKAVSAATLVDYAPDSIVSRILVQGKAGGITLFAFDKGQALSEHTAPFDAVVQVLDGRARVRVGGKPIVAAAGQLVLMPANVPHAVEAVQRFKMLLVMLRGA